MAMKRTSTKAERSTAIRSNLSGPEQELFDLLVAHYVRGEAQRKNILGSYHRSGMDPERVRAVALAAITYLADSPRRPNDGRYPRQMSLYSNAMGGDVVHLFRPNATGVSARHGDPLPLGAWEIVAIEVIDADCPPTERGRNVQR